MNESSGGVPLSINNQVSTNKAFYVGTVRADAPADVPETRMPRVEMFPCLLFDIFGNCAYTETEAQLVRESCKRKNASQECTKEMRNTCTRAIKMQTWLENEVARLRQEGRLK
jgi:hypothetical protein